MISLRGVGKSFDGGETWAIRDLTLQVEAGETVVLLGSSGCGKTTTLKLINRLVEPTEGNVLVGGDDISGRDPVELRRDIGYVFQGIGLFPHMSVRDNVEVVPRLLGWPPADRRSRSDELLEMVGMSAGEHGDRFPDELSGGQQQRVGVARALAADPAYLLMDEPFGALDAVTRDALQQQLLALKDELETTVVFVTHDIFEALAIGDRIAVLDGGRLEQVGAPEELVGRPATPFVRELFGKPAKQLAAFEALR
jgi:osmoprotectant transport system ATP-binding protein